MAGSNNDKCAKYTIILGLHDTLQQAIQRFSTTGWSWTKLPLEYPGRLVVSKISFVNGVLVYVPERCSKNDNCVVLLQF